MADAGLMPTVRRATSLDAPMLLTWRNDPYARAASISSEAVSPETHAAWLADSLRNTRRYLLIVELADEPVGMVRFDALEVPGTWMVSINLAAGARGRGLAAPVLQAGWDWLEAAVPVEQVTATIRVANTVSVRAFERAGYRLVATEDGLHHYARTGRTPEESGSADPTHYRN
jgi:RimJ/RimL family protein N-acetyltransferase